jgi:phospholipase C
MSKGIAKTGVLAAGSALAAVAAILAPAGTQAQPSPIQHIVIIDMENHSFDNVLGYWCDQNPARCPAGGMPASVTLSDGTVVTSGVTPDLIPDINHSMASQLAAMDGGKMDGWQNQVYGCGASTGYQCVSGYQPSAIPNITALASAGAISDRFFSAKDSPSWGGHLYPVLGTTDGFTGDNPVDSNASPGPGWGCNSNKVARVSAGGTFQPSCIPDYGLGLRNGGAFEPTHMMYAPSIMDRLGAAGLSWKIYGPANPADGGYDWNTCASLAECFYTSQKNNVAEPSQFLADASAGTLPSFSLVVAGGAGGLAQDSCHNKFSMTACDNYIGKLASAVMASRDWPSTALIITMDDYGGFYDHVPPGTNPDGTLQGTRLPLIVLSPYAKPSYTDDTPASFYSILAFVEQNFGLSPLEANDASAYHLSAMFNLTAAPNLGNRPHMVTRPVPKGERIDWAAAREAT